MDDKEHVFTCEREMGRLRQNRSKLSRAHTYAIGQGQIDDSPTAPNRSKSSSSDLMMTEMSPFGLDRAQPRRVVSY
jgi:M-phase inducer tyrosine phosphatase